MPRALRISLHAGLLLVLLGIGAWIAGEAFIFPSLGPSAFDLAADPERPYNRPAHVIGGHFLGILIGMAVFGMIAPQAPFMLDRPPFSPVAIGLAVSAIVSVVLTTVSMMATRLVHPPACATTLIAAVGLLSGPVDGLFLMAAVLLLVGCDLVLRRVWPTERGR